MRALTHPGGAEAAGADGSGWLAAGVAVLAAAAVAVWLWRRRVG